MSYSCFDILTAKEDLVYRACENRSMFIAEGNRLQQFVQGQKIKFSIGKNEKKMWIYNEQKQKAFKTKIVRKFTKENYWEIFNHRYIK